jgi:hypothetical protein
MAPTDVKPEDSRYSQAVPNTRPLLGNGSVIEEVLEFVLCAVRAAVI